MKEDEREVANNRVCLLSVTASIRKRNLILGTSIEKTHFR